MTSRQLMALGLGVVAASVAAALVPAPPPCCGDPSTCLCSLRGEIARGLTSYLRGAA